VKSRSLTVAVCTHNPRTEVFERVLAALRQQTLDQAEWELIIVDNASEPSLGKRIAKLVPSNGRVVVENKLGLTSARLRAISESTGSLLTFVDDDNIVAPNYLDCAWRIERDWPQLGVWGGQRVPGWEAAPPDWTRPYWGMLSIAEFDRAIWHNCSRDPAFLPTGAGMCVRREIAHAYVKRIRSEPLRASFDRIGRSLGSCGDFDIAFVAQSEGYGVGLFPDLKLTHVIPAERLSETYLLRLREGISFSTELLNVLDGVEGPSTDSGLTGWLRRQSWRLRMSPRQYRFFAAHDRGVNAARRFLRDATSAGSGALQQARSGD